MAAELASKIDSGELAPGARLSSVRALSKEYGVSGMTAQKALGQLADDGYAEAVSGLGYFVKEPPQSEGKTLDEAVAAIAEQLDGLQESIADLRARVDSLEGGR